MTILVIILVVAAFILVVFDARRGQRRASKTGSTKGQKGGNA